jgi:hypothetical protein
MNPTEAQRQLVLAYLAQMMGPQTPDQQAVQAAARGGYRLPPRGDEPPMMDFGGTDLPTHAPLPPRRPQEPREMPQAVRAPSQEPGGLMGLLRGLFGGATPERLPPLLDGIDAERAAKRK